MTTGDTLVCIDPGEFTEELTKGQLYTVAQAWDHGLLVCIDTPERAYPRYYQSQRFAVVHPAATEPRYQPNDNRRLYWCNSHRRRATHLLFTVGARIGSPHCAPDLGGIMLTCNAVDLTDQVDPASLP